MKIKCKHCQALITQQRENHLYCSKIGCQAARRKASRKKAVSTCKAPLLPDVISEIKTLMEENNQVTIILRKSVMKFRKKYDILKLENEALKLIKVKYIALEIEYKKFKATQKKTIITSKKSLNIKPLDVKESQKIDSSQTEQLLDNKALLNTRKENKRLKLKVANLEARYSYDLETGEI